MCACVENNVIYVAHGGGSINGGSWSERERERERSVLLCRAGSYYTDKKCSVMKKNKKESSKNEVLLG